MSKIHLCTYGSHRFEYSRWRLAKEADDTGWFDHIHVYGKEHIGQFGRSIEGTGAGFWWWSEPHFPRHLAWGWWEVYRKDPLERGVCRWVALLWRVNWLLYQDLRSP